MEQLKRKTQPLVGKRYMLPFILVTSLFFLWGFARAILDVLNKHFQTSLNISITESALIQVTTYLGYFLMAIPAGAFINRYGYRGGVVFGLILYAIGAFLFIPVSSIGTLNPYLVALFIIACGLAFLETSANPYSTELGPQETATSRLNLSQSFNGLGSGLAPMLIGGFLFTSEDADVSLPYTIMGVLVVVVAVIFCFVKLPEIHHEEEPQALQSKGSTIENLKALVCNSYFLTGLLALLAYEVSEISINSYFVNFTTGMGWMDAATSSYILSFSLIIFMGGRFLGSWIMKYVPAERMLLYCSIGSVVSIILVIITGIAEADETVSWTKYLPVIFLMFNYLFEAIMFPTIFSLALKNLGGLTKTASSLLMMTPVGGCGFLLMGYLADSTTLIIPFVIPLIGYLIVLLFAKRALQKL